MRNGTIPARRADGEAPSMEKSRKEFLARWIPMGIRLWSEAEGYGIDWRKCRLEELDFLISLAEQTAEGKEYA